ncbi:hypothetical protein OF001_U260043 [Pseudomonas sp. OF001]|nr:hypothetical protein OF001_U260043 [Pseudomonas sp. OF001]
MVQGAGDQRRGARRSRVHAEDGRLPQPGSPVGHPQLPGKRRHHGVSRHAPARPAVRQPAAARPGRAGAGPAVRRHRRLGSAQGGGIRELPSLQLPAGRPGARRRRRAGAEARRQPGAAPGADVDHAGREARRRLAQLRLEGPLPAPRRTRRCHAAGALRPQLRVQAQRAGRAGQRAGGDVRPLPARALAGRPRHPPPQGSAQRRGVRLPPHRRRAGERAVVLHELGVRRAHERQHPPLSEPAAGLRRHARGQGGCGDGHARRDRLAAPRSRGSAAQGRRQRLSGDGPPAVGHRHGGAREQPPAGLCPGGRPGGADRLRRTGKGLRALRPALRGARAVRGRGAGADSRRVSVAPAPDRFHAPAWERLPGAGALSVRMAHPTREGGRE